MSSEVVIETKGYRHGARAVAPLAVAVAGFGISFGVLARTAGLGPLSPIVMSATTFAGSAQFAAISVLTEGGTVAAAVAAAFLALLVPQLRGRRTVQVALLCGAIALVLTPVAPAGVPIVAASAACLLGARR